MREIPIVHCWNGRPVEELTRDELLEVVRYLGRQVSEFMTPENINALAHGKADLMVRSIKEDVASLKRSQVWPDECGRTPSSPVYTRGLE